MPIPLRKFRKSRAVRNYERLARSQEFLPSPLHPTARRTAAFTLSAITAIFRIVPVERRLYVREIIVWRLVVGQGGRESSGSSGRPLIERDNSEKQEILRFGGGNMEPRARFVPNPPFSMRLYVSRDRAFFFPFFFFFHIPSIRKDCSAIREEDLFFPLEFYRTEIERY